MQRGNNRQAVFFRDADYHNYLTTLFEAALRHAVDVHAYVLMTNHVHLFVTPHTSGGLSAMMQMLGRTYVGLVNYRHQRTGTLWEGRFKASAVDTDSYGLACYRYIEFNPVRAGMVTDPARYEWSSCVANVAGQAGGLLVPHPVYVALGETAHARRTAYRDLLESGMPAVLLDTLRLAVRKGIPVGTDAFKARIDAALGRPLGDRRCGRRWPARGS